MFLPTNDRFQALNELMGEGMDRRALIGLGAAVQAARTGNLAATARLHHRRGCAGLRQFGIVHSP